MTNMLALALLAAVSGGQPAPEVSVWRSNGLIEGMTGWVVTQEKIVVYVGPTREQSSQVASFTTAYAATLLDSFGRFSAYNGQSLTCGRIKDGWTLSVEGSGADGQFALSSATPNLCTDGPAHELWQAYMLLAGATRGAP